MGGADPDDNPVLETALTGAAFSLRRNEFGGDGVGKACFAVADTVVVVADRTMRPAIIRAVAARKNVGAARTPFVAHKIGLPE
jgi:hypothetical protein